MKNLISLGNKCYVSKDLRKLGLRNVSFPFDWVVSDLISVCKVLDSNFDEVFTENNFYRNRFDRSVYKLMYKDINLTFKHDFLPNISFANQFHLLISAVEGLNAQKSIFDNECIFIL